MGHPVVSYNLLLPNQKYCTSHYGAGFPTTMATFQFFSLNLKIHSISNVVINDNNQILWIFISFCVLTVDTESLLPSLPLPYLLSCSWDSHNIWYLLYHFGFVTFRPLPLPSSSCARCPSYPSGVPEWVSQPGGTGSAPCALALFPRPEHAWVKWGAWFVRNIVDRPC